MSGDIRLAGRSVADVRADQLARLGLCTIPEGRGIFPNLTVRENLMMCTHTGSQARRHRSDRLRTLPAPRRASRPAGRHDVGRRAADAGHVARARHRTRRAAARRAVDGAGAADRRSPVRDRRPGRRRRRVRCWSSNSSPEPCSASPIELPSCCTDASPAVGPPDELADELSSAYLGGKGQP